MKSFCKKISNHAAAGFFLWFVCRKILNSCTKKFRIDHCPFNKMQSYYPLRLMKEMKKIWAEITECVSCWWREKVRKRPWHCKKVVPGCLFYFLHSKSQWTNSIYINYQNDVEPFATTCSKFIWNFKQIVGMLSTRD